MPDFWKQPIQGYDPWACDLKRYRFDRKVAKAVCDFFPEHLTHNKGKKWAGRKFNLEPWQRQFIGHLFGWKQRENGRRRYSEALLYIPKKSGKTALAAGIGLIMLVADNEPGAEVYSAAGDVDQARLLFDFAHHSVEANATLRENIEVYVGYKAMKYADVQTPTQSYWKVLSAEAKTKHGPNPHCILIDELHIQHDWELIDTLSRGVVAREQPLTVYLTTADYDRPSPCNEIYERACGIRDGVIPDPTFLPVIYEARETDDWTSEAVWRKANPNYGVTLEPDYFHREVAKALESRTKENSFKRLHLNIRTTAQRKWLDLSEWDASGDSGLTIEKLEGAPCYVGVDLGSTDDLTVCGLYFPQSCAFTCRVFAPEVTIERRIEYQQWREAGFLEAMPGKVADQAYVKQAVLDAKETYQVLDVAYDPWHAAQLAKELEDDEGVPVIEFRQGYRSLNEPSKALEKMVMKGELTHFANPVLRWMAANVEVKEDPAGNIKPMKPGKSSPKKIDGIICLIMGIGLALNNEGEPEPGSVYDQPGRGLLSL